jgi:hypothetical protein
MNITVEMHSGYKADEYPKRLRFGDRCLEVLDIEDRWYGPGYSYFRVFADDGRTHILRQDLETDSWELRTT